MSEVDQQQAALKAAVREGIIEALQSDAAKDAVLDAIGSWFDRQSGKAMRKLLSAIALAGLIMLANGTDVVSNWVKSLGK